MKNPALKIKNLNLTGNVLLAPMAGVTDLPFRLLCKEQGCSMVYSEMISAKGLYYRSDKTEKMLEIHPDEHPMGIQIFGSEPNIMKDMARKISQTNVALIDINMGCPAPKIVKNGEGSALMRDPDKVRRIVAEVVAGSSKPVTIKIRKGWDDSSINAVEIAKIAWEEGAAAVTVHGRTREQFYSGRADWEIIRRVKQEVDIPIIGNGDVFEPIDAKKMLTYTGCDGIMVGRGAQGNPWIFKRIIHYINTGQILPEPTNLERILLSIRHLEIATSFKGERIGVSEMRKHIAWYLKGMKNANTIKNQINTLNSMDDVRSVLQKYVEKI